MPLGREVGLGPGHIVLDGDSAPPAKRGHSSPPLFEPCVLWPNGWMDQDANWYGGRLGPGDIVLDGDPATPRKAAQHPLQFSAHVYCGQTVAHLSNCLALVQSFGCS